MNYDERFAAYRDQRGTIKLTPGQRRRLEKKGHSPKTHSHADLPMVEVGSVEVYGQTVPLEGPVVVRMRCEKCHKLPKGVKLGGS